MAHFIDELINELKAEQVLSTFVKVSDQELLLGDQSYAHNSFSSIFPLGIGKAAAEQTQALITRLKKFPHLQRKLLRGMVLTKDEHQLESDDFICYTSSHPLLDQRALSNTERLQKCLQSLTEDTLIICSLSGGTSALLESLPPSISLSYLQQLNDELLHSAATIEQINIIRQTLSLIKNGGLLGYSSAKRTAVLVYSDVCSNDLRFIGSGPFYFSPVHPDLVEKTAKYFLSPALQGPLIEWLLSPQFKEMQKKIMEEQRSKEVHHLIVMDWARLLKAGKEVLHRLIPHFSLIAAPYPVEGNFTSGIHWHRQQLLKHLDLPHLALMSSGELPVEVKGEGLGGRNTHFVLSMGIELFETNALQLTPAELQEYTILSLATDGSDGPTNGAGAYLTYDLWLKAKDMGLDPRDYFARFDSYHFFEKMGSIIHTGPTGNNIMDFRLITRGLNFTV